MSPPVLGVGILVACGLGQPSFTEAWYEEVLLGQVESAFYQYQHIYRASDGEYPPEVRRRAALRAGACAEKLGNLQDARRAYEWLIAGGSPGSAESRQAVSRLRRLAPAKEEAGAGEDAAAGTSAVDEHLVLLEGVLGRRRRALRQARETADRQRQLAGRVGRVTGDLRRLGVEIRWPAVEFPGGGTEASAGAAAAEPRSFEGEPAAEAHLWVDRFLRSLGLDRQDETLLRRRLAQSFYRRGLAALRGGDLREAYRDFLFQREVLPGGEGDAPDLVQAEAFLASLRKILDAASGLRRIAAALLPENAARREAGVQSRMAEALLDAARRRLPQERGQALELLLRANREEDWAPAALADSGRLREISLEADRHRRGLVETAAREDLLRSKLRQGKRLGEEIALLVEEIVLPGPVPASWTRPRLEDPRTMLPTLRRQVERVLDRVEALPVDRPPESTAPRPELPETVIADTLTLLEWFPDLDPSGQYARRLQRHLR